jgi:hypothetical protein
MLSAIRSSNRIQVETSNIVQGRKDITTRESGDSEQAARVRRKDKNSKYRSAMKISRVRWKQNKGNAPCIFVRTSHSQQHNS